MVNLIGLTFQKDFIISCTNSLKAKDGKCLEGMQMVNPVLRNILFDYFHFISLFYPLINLFISNGETQGQ